MIRKLIAGESYDEQTCGLSAESILVDADEIKVDQQALWEITHSAGKDVCRDDQRRWPHGPKGHVRALLRLGQAEVAENQHVRVVSGT